MRDLAIRPAFDCWPEINRRLREAVRGLTVEQLALRLGPDRWPLWAIVGHAACQRVFWLCDFGGEPGAGTTRFTNAAWNCPGDEGLEHPLDAAELVEALDATFAIVERCLDGWTLPMLGDELRHPEWGEGWVHTRGAVIQRVLAHDIWHIAELNETFTAAGLPPIDPWT